MYVYFVATDTNTVPLYHAEVKHDTIIAVRLLDKWPVVFGVTY